MAIGSKLCQPDVQLQTLEYERPVRLLRVYIN